MSFSRPIQWYRYHSHEDPIWPDGTFNVNQTTPWNSLKNLTKIFISFFITVVYPSNPKLNLHVDLDLNLDPDF